MALFPVDIGDPAPWFSARVGDGSGTVAVDELAGRFVLLFFFDATTRTGVAAALSGLESRGEIFDGKRAIFLGISSDPDDFALRCPPRRAGYLYLLDSNARAATLYGLTALPSDSPAGAFRPTAFLLSPMLQVLEIVPLTDTCEFVSQIDAALGERLPAAAEPDTPPVLVVPRVFDRDLCDRLINLYDAAGGREIGAVERGGEIVERFDQQFRRRFDYYIEDEAALHRCRDMLSRRLLPMVYRAFQFKVTRIERYLVGCYDSATGGYFRPHRDNTQPIVAHRRFALTIVLNDDFRGGELSFPEFGSGTCRAHPGDAIVFSCALLHEVMPVTHGRRYSFISFLYDEASHRIREQYMRSTLGASDGSLA